ncbi:MAG: FAD-dependent oxidoreductase [Proteobacteria bacterium]|nr:FAD-dependent oxidoreductase [Pseudomonadota bacterium]
MIIGGGIGGMQAALDLADSGFYVYLVEKSSSIGGRMAQLDKTFPTNDCSMCIMSPKLVECGRHLNIEILTLSEIESIAGEQGNFHVKVHQKARYINPDKCTGCGDCAQACPVILPDEFNQGLGTRTATYLTYPQSVPRVYAIDKKDRPPCNAACPAHINVQGYVAMIKAGKYREAIEIIMKDMPLPGILGRVCVRFCEEECRRREVDEALSIKELKRFAADQVDILSLPLPDITPREDKVAIIGSGPSGLAAAYFLALDGYKPTIFEALPVAGGWLAVGIPEFRLPRNVLNTEIENIKRFGVEIKTGTPIGKDRSIDDLFSEGFKAVYVAAGAHNGMKLNIPGEDRYDSFHQCATWLTEVNLGTITEIKGKVIVLGGGNAAIDAARVSLRLGAEEVHIVYRRSRDEMPADPIEIDEALEEGVKLHILVAPKTVMGDNNTLTGLECLKNRLGEPDSSGRRRPVPIEGSEFFIAADHIIAAIGQSVDTSFAAGVKDMEFSANGLAVVNPHTLETTKRSVFAGGDVVTGPKTVIEAMAQGKRAAASIAAYLQGQEMPSLEGMDSQEKDYKPIDASEPKMPRAQIPTSDVSERIKSFQESNLSMDEETAKGEASRCLDCGVCCECFQCVEACKAQAVDHDMTDKWLDINVGSVILASGFQPYDPAINDTYQYTHSPNVVTGLEFERILSASGPYEGHLIRPSDNKEPKKIAWIQCVGSRNIHAGDRGYCSGVCCTYAIKQAMVAKEHSDAPLDTAIFYIDIRTYGKEFEKFYNRARNEVGVRFIKSRISNILPGEEEGNLKIRYTDEIGRIIQEEFDIVVLSVGLDIPQESIDLAQKIGVDLNSYNFISTSSFNPVHTTKPGIFVCGAFQGPKDIPETVMQASGSAAASSGLLASQRHTLTKEKQYPDEIDIAGQEPRIGVFVCHCGINIAGVVDVPEVTEYASKLPNVVVTDENLFTCSQDTQDTIKEKIHEHKLNRVVVASCSARTHEPLFQDTIREAGLNPYLFSMANIRDQDSWVHQSDKEGATEKAKDLVRMAVANAAKLSPLYRSELPVVKRALVIGGGIAGMTAALNIAEQGFEVVLVEIEKELGGFAKNIHKTLQGDDVQNYLADLIDKVTHNEKIQILTETLVADFSGTKGNFKTALTVGPAMYHREVNHGVLIMATGASEYTPTEYLYGEHDSVKTQVELEDMVLREEHRIKEWKDVVMIQCVGSRNEENPNCSRICCQEAIKNALALKEINPDINIFILYRDIRTYGFQEDYYRKSREMGIHFLRYPEDQKPLVEQVEGKLQVTFKDLTLARAIKMNPDQVILSTGVVAGDTEELANIVKVPLTSERFFLEAHVKLRPVDTQSDGIFICGMAHSPRLIDESISQALAASSRACCLLSQDSIEVGGVVAKVDPDLCAACLICVRTCPYEVPFINEDGVSEIDISKCHGCGICAAECPAKAITLSHFEDTQILAQIDALLEAI